MRLRCRLGNTVTAFGSDLTLTTSCLLDLKNAISVLTNIPINQLTVKAGFPPKAIMGSATDTLSACGIMDGDLLIVETNGMAACPSGPNPVSEASTCTATTSSTAQTTNPAPTYICPIKHTSVKRAFRNCFISPARHHSQAPLFPFLGDSWSYLLERNPDISLKLRKTIADKILLDPVNYNAAILGKDPVSYTNWIMQPNSWGGGIELALFSEYYQTEIYSIDVSTSRIDKFGDGLYDSRVFIIYSGIHFDAIVWTPSADAPYDFDQTLFTGPEAANAEHAALQLAAIWKKQRKYTDTANFTLKCGICSVGLVGEKDARMHASTTGHVSFSEY
ncbi:hypothetical protein BASA60_003868 [Batrachochytrium salamandrivorans]|nr:hypothetical protein BASA60_003868 [Batrachochytrium salamandrivorans]